MNFFVTKEGPPDGRQLIVYENDPSPLPFRVSCYVLVLVSADICSALVATTLVLLAHLVYHRRHRRHHHHHHHHHHHDRHRDDNATTVCTRTQIHIL